VTLVGSGLSGMLPKMF